MEVTEDEQEILSQMAIALIAVAHSQKLLAKDGKLAEKKKKKTIPSYTRLQRDGAVQERSHECSIPLVFRAHSDTILLENVFQQSVPYIFFKNCLN